jgi:hypothetical protein
VEREVPGRAGPPGRHPRASRPGYSPATPPGPISWCWAGTAIRAAWAQVSARSSTRCSTTPTCPSPSSRRATDASGLIGQVFPSAQVRAGRGQCDGRRSPARPANGPDQVPSAGNRLV